MKTEWTRVRRRRVTVAPPPPPPEPITTPRYAESDEGWLDEPYGTVACFAEVVL